MSKYSELLKDPRWQKKRLEIFQLDRWQCRNCESKTGTLNVHHLYYDRDKYPWEYDNICLITLCEKCHSEAHSIDWQKAFLDIGYTPQQLLDLALTLKFRGILMEKETSEVIKKHKARFNPIIIPIYSMFENVNEHLESYNFISSNKNRYLKIN